VLSAGAQAAGYYPESPSANAQRKWLAVSSKTIRRCRQQIKQLHSRTNEWVTMSPQDRVMARLNSAKTKELSKQLTPDEKKAMETYSGIEPGRKKAKLLQMLAPACGRCCNR
jgi:hypothetical protein